MKADLKSPSHSGTSHMRHCSFKFSFPPNGSYKSVFNFGILLHINKKLHFLGRKSHERQASCDWQSIINVLTAVYTFTLDS